MCQAVLAIAEADDHIFVLLGNDMISALDEKTGDQLWIAQGPEPQNLSGGSASDSSAQLIAVDGNTVAYIASYGVFSGHDAQTGELLWSHEGYEAATSSIQTENDRFIVIDAAGLWVDGQEVAPIGTASVVSLSVGNTRIDNCSELFSSSATGLATALPPTPEGEIVADGFRIQAIDPVTGDVLWEQQTAPGVGSAWNQAPGRGVTSSICAVEVGDGTAIALTGHDDAASDGTVVIGSVSDGVFYSGIVDDDMQAIGAVIGSAAMLSDTVVYGIARDGAVFLQLVDGTLIRVDVD